MWFGAFLWSMSSRTMVSMDADVLCKIAHNLLKTP